MPTSYEKKAARNKALSTLGYGIMWLFVAILAGVLPFYTGNDFAVFYATGGLALLAGMYKIVKGARQLP